MVLMLEELKGRHDAAQKRLAAATQKFQTAQQELQAAQSECSVWSAAVNIEAREENARQAAANEKQFPMPLIAEPTPSPSAAAPSHAAAVCLDVVPESSHPSETINKTDLIRDLLRQHASGMTPADMWESAKGQVSSRAYLYAILKRLRDKDEVTLRRKKYVLKFKPLEVKAGSEAVTVQ